MPDPLDKYGIRTAYSALQGFDDGRGVEREIEGKYIFNRLGFHCFSFDSIP